MKQRIVGIKHCKKCNSLFESHTYKKKETEYCSKKCANSRIHSVETTQKISKTLKLKVRPPKTILHKICELCNKPFTVEMKHKNRRYCSRSCSNSVAGTKGGKVSASKRVLRSKNEIYFYDLCKHHFNNVKNNARIFNGWDADVVIEDHKIAVLWNGVWHYKKVMKDYDLRRTQKNDTKRLIQIEACGYTAYTIRDDGKFNPYFVEEKFKEFLEYL